MKKTAILTIACSLLLAACGGRGTTASATLPPHEAETPISTTPPIANTESPKPESPHNLRLSESLLYAGTSGDSSWYFVEQSENADSFEIGVFTFYENTVDFSSGYLASEVTSSEQGKYSVTENGNLYMEFVSDHVLQIYEFAVQEDGDGLILTQLSGSGVFYAHEKGHQLSLQKGRYPENISLYYPGKTADTGRQGGSQWLDSNAIEQIQQWRIDVHNKLSKATVESFGDAATVYWVDGRAVKVDANVMTQVEPEPSGYVAHYYYNDGTPYFATICGTGKNDIYLQLYFAQGRIIRSYEKHGNSDSGVIRDGNNPAYQIYYDKAVAEYKNVEDAHGKGAGVESFFYQIGDYKTVYGSSCFIPQGFTVDAQRAPTGLGYDYRFFCQELDMTIYLYEAYTPAVPPTGSDMMASDYAYYLNNSNVTYFPHGDDWFVASGYSPDGTSVFYRRVHGVSDYYYSYLISYPVTNKEICDQIVGQFAESFHALDD